MTFLDWSIVGLYMLAMIALSFWLSKSQNDEADYYVGGRKLSWKSTGISMMATQSSAVSFISIPAFVALQDGGGLGWLQWELAPPLAMIAVACFIAPVLRRLELVSIYEYLELRYGASTRTMLSATFLISRGLAAGVTLYAAAIILSATLGIPVFWVILLLGVVVTLYDMLGGMTAVVYSDVIQMVILVSGLFLCIGFAVAEVGSVSDVIAAFPQARWNALDVAGETSTPFWPCLFGGLFLYISYYGADQSIAQRSLATKSLRDTRLALIFNGFARFPLVASYALLGIAAYALYHYSPALQEAVGASKADYLVPYILLLHIPEGLRGIILAAILAAAMSSLDSYINSLSAATMRDFVDKIKKMSPEQNLRTGKLVTVVWGALVILAAYCMSTANGTVVEVINKLGSCFYGPILAAFLSGILTRKIHQIGINAGVIAGVGFNMYLWLAHPELYWSWWNVTGLLLAMLVAYSISVMTPAYEKPVADACTYEKSGTAQEIRPWLPAYISLAVYFSLLLTLLYGLSTYAQR